MSIDMIILILCIGIATATFLGGYIRFTGCFTKFFRYVVYMFSSETATEYYKKINKGGK